jgi:FimV-like protein
MDNRMVKRFFSKKNILKVSLLFVASLLAVCSNAMATNDINLKVFPKIGKPLYAIAEFASYLEEPISLNVVNKSEYQRLGYDRTEFLNTAKVRKVAPKRYSITTTSLIDTNVFVLILEAEFKDFSRVYPIAMELKGGQVEAVFGDVVDYTFPVSKPLAASLGGGANKQQAITELTRQGGNVYQADNVPTVITPQTSNRRVLEYPNEVYREPVTRYESYDQATPNYSRQRDVVYVETPPQQTTIIPPANSSMPSFVQDQNPFYTVIIVMTVLLLVGMFVVVLFMHKNQDSRHHSQTHDNSSVMSDLIKTLPTLMGSSQSSSNQQQVPLMNVQGAASLPSSQYWDLPRRQYSHPGYMQDPDMRGYSSNERNQYFDRNQADWETGYPSDVNHHVSANRASTRSDQFQSTDAYVGYRETQQQQQSQSRARTQPQAQTHTNRPTGSMAGSQFKGPQNEAKPSQSTAGGDIMPSFEGQPVNRDQVSNKAKPIQRAISQPNRAVPPVKREQIARENPIDVNQAQNSPRSVSPKTSVNSPQTPPKVKVPHSPSSAPASAGNSQVSAHEKSEKLQLAIVYKNMGDDVMAKMLLDEISRDGSPAEKNEAKTILATMENIGDGASIVDKDDSN